MSPGSPSPAPQTASLLPASTPKIDEFLDSRRIREGIFTISGRLHPISIRDQILRAHEFVRRALEARLIKPDTPPPTFDASFLVVGAGAAGATAAILAATAGVRTILAGDRHPPRAEGGP